MILREASSSHSPLEEARFPTATATEEEFTGLFLGSRM
jgi:hypothetical protein